MITINSSNVKYFWISSFLIFILFTFIKGGGFDSGYFFAVLMYFFACLHIKPYIFDGDMQVHYLGSLKKEESKGLRFFFFLIYLVWAVSALFFYLKNNEARQLKIMQSNL